jgi:hypothetical protein
MRSRCMDRNGPAATSMCGIRSSNNIISHSCVHACGTATAAMPSLKIERLKRVCSCQVGSEGSGCVGCVDQVGYVLHGCWANSDQEATVLAMFTLCQPIMPHVTQNGLSQ